MTYSSVKKETEKLENIESDYINIITAFREKRKKKIIASPCCFVPPEINAAFNIITLKIPEFLAERDDFIKIAPELYDAFVIPDTDCLCGTDLPPGLPVYSFRITAGYGEDAAVSLHNEIQLMLSTLFDIELKSISIDSLKKETVLFEKLRRLVRGFCALRTENRDLLTNRELSLIFETSLILPPETALECLTPVYEAIRRINGKAAGPFINILFYGGKNIPAVIADSIEEMGMIVAEDDCCTGRRAFDMSLNAESDYIFYEILDSYSYRPLTPCMRPVTERYELLYKLLRNYGIEAVIFFRGDRCELPVKDIDYLRIRMMRDGIDPLVIDKKNYMDIVSGYMSKF